MLGYVYLNSDFTGSVGYSGKPMRMLVGIDTAGVITGLKLVEHKEPIVLVGVPEQRVVEAVNKLIGTRIGPIAAGKERAPQPDIVSGATVTMLVMADSVVRSAVRLLRRAALAGPGDFAAAAAPGMTKAIDASQGRGSGLARASSRTARSAVCSSPSPTSIAAFERSGKARGCRQLRRPEIRTIPSSTFTPRLSACQRSARAFLAKAGYEQLRGRLKPGQQAILVAGDGLLFIQRSGYVRGGIFDRIEILQAGSGTRFSDRNHERLGALAAAGAPTLREIGAIHSSR